MGPTVSERRTTHLSPSVVNYGPRVGQKDFCLSLLLLLDTDNDDGSLVAPLPSSHLPVKLSSLNLYGINLLTPLHKMMV